MGVDFNNCEVNRETKMIFIYFLCLMSFFPLNMSKHLLVETYDEPSKVREHGVEYADADEQNEEADGADDGGSDESEDELIEWADCNFKVVMDDGDYKKFQGEEKSAKLKAAKDLKKTIEDSKDAALKEKESGKNETQKAEVKETVEKIEKGEAKPTDEKAEQLGKCLVDKVLDKEKAKEVKEEEKAVVAEIIGKEVKKVEEEEGDKDGKKSGDYSSYYCSYNYNYNYCNGYYKNYCGYYGCGTYRYCYYYKTYGYC